MNNNLKVLFRHLTNYRTFSIINISGLAIGIATSFIIAMWVFDELSYDRFHEKADRIFRVERDMVFKGESSIVPVTTGLYGPTLADQFPEIIDYVKIDKFETSMIDENGNQHVEEAVFASDNFFKVFSFPLDRGSEVTALSEVNSIVISQDAAKRYFGNEDPIGKTIKMKEGGEPTNLKVTGLLKKMPSNKHFDFDFLVSFKTFDALNTTFDPNTWLSNSMYTYLLLQDGASYRDVEEKIQVIAKEYVIPAYATYFGGELEGSLELKLRPITDIHLYSNLFFDIQEQGNITTVYVFIAISILVLVIAGLNFMNLSTALAGTRALEVGVRKSIGATRNELILQFVKESLIITMLAFIIAIALIELFLPTFNNLVAKELSLSMFYKPVKLMMILGLIVLIGLVSGVYPAFFLSSFKPIKVLRDGYQSKVRKLSLRQVLVVTQFSISIGLIIATLVIYRQIGFFIDEPLGFKKDEVIVIPVQSGDVGVKYNSFKNELMNHPEIEQVASSTRVPLEGIYSDVGWDNEMKKEKEVSHFFYIGYGFLELYGLEFVAGRGFEEKSKVDTINKVLVSELVVKNLGYSNPEDAVGTKFHSDLLFRDSTLQKGTILGVFNDFHFNSLKEEIRPLALLLDDRNMRRISISYKKGKDAEVLGVIQNTWEEFFPEIQFSYSYMDERIRSNYIAEMQMKEIILGFTILAIFIASLGLYGLAAFVARKKIKEIGVRKVFGASVSNIIYLLSKSFSKWVLLANIIAWPIAYYLMGKWLQNFAYSIKMEIWIFLFSAMIAFVIALLTVTYHSAKAANSNPVDAIRYE